MEYYPEQLKRIVELCEALDTLEGPDSAWPAIVSPLKLISEDGEDMGELRDEVGGAWSWTPPVETEDEPETVKDDDSGEKASVVEFTEVSCPFCHARAGHPCTYIVPPRSGQVRSRIHGDRKGAVYNKARTE